MARKTSTKSSNTVTLKPVARSEPSAPSTAKTSAPRPKVVAGPVPVSSSEMVRKQDFIDAAVARTDVKKRDAKPAIEAALAELVDTLAAGKDVHLPPLGKIKVVKTKDLGNGSQVLTLKLRTMKATDPD